MSIVLLKVTDENLYDHRIGRSGIVGMFKADEKTFEMLRVSLTRLAPSHSSQCWLRPTWCGWSAPVDLPLVPPDLGALSIEWERPVELARRSNAAQGRPKSSRAPR